MPVNYYFNLLTALEDFLSRSFTLFPCSYQPFSFYGQLFYSTSIFLWIFVLFLFTKNRIVFYKWKGKVISNLFFSFFIINLEKNKQKTNINHPLYKSEEDGLLNELINFVKLNF
jgi:hypothetical protein